MPDEEQVVNNNADENPAGPEATTDENNDSQADELRDPSLDDSQQDTEEDDESNDSDDSEDNDTDKPKRGADARKEQLNKDIDNANKDIRDLVAEKNNVYAKREAIRQGVERVNSQFYKAASVDQLMDETNPDTGDPYTRLEAQFEASQQERAIEKYNSRIADSQMSLQYEGEKALEDFPMFDDQSPEYNKDLAEQVDTLLGNAIVRDPRTGQIVGSSISPYQLYKAFAMATKSGATSAEVNAHKNVERMTNNADRSSTGSRPSPKSFDKMSLKEQEAHLRKKGHDV